MATTAYATCPQCRMPGADSAESTHAFCGREARAGLEIESSESLSRPDGKLRWMYRPR